MLNALKPLLKKSNKKSPDLRPSREYVGRVYYSEKRCYNKGFVDDVINPDNIAKIWAGFFGKSTSPITCGTFVNEREWISASENRDCFDNIACDYALRNYDCMLTKGKQFVYVPDCISMFDADSLTEYLIVIIDDVIELRQIDYIVHELNAFEGLVDKSTEIKDPLIIQRMRNTILTALNIANAKSQHKSSTKNAKEELRGLYSLFTSVNKEITAAINQALADDDIWSYLLEHNYFTYFDPYSKTAEIVFNLNLILSKFDLPLMSNYENEHSLYNLLAICSNNLVDTGYDLVGVRTENNGVFVTAFKINEIHLLEAELAYYHLATQRFSNKSNTI